MGKVKTKKPKVVKVIHFEDGGQAYLRWSLDEKGNVIKCKPSEEWLWCKGRVTNHENLKVGGEVKWKHNELHSEKSAPVTMDYLIKKLEV